jgi:VWFA-related protein
MTTRLATVALAVLTAAAIVRGEQRIFRGESHGVTVSASIRKGGTPVNGLAATDFKLYDNGVPQEIESVSLEPVPIDVTLFMDTSGSTSKSLESMQNDVKQIAAMLRPVDPYRLFTIGVSVYNSLPWRAPGDPLTLDVKPTMGISLIYDALVLALAHTPDPGRRHLVVAMTDGEDCGSLIDVERLVEVSKRSEAVLYVVFMGQPGEPPLSGVLAACPWVAPIGKDRSVTWKQDRLVDAAEVTGGATYASPYGDGTVARFRRAFEDFRHSYVLRYTPEGVPAAGWHQLRLELPDKKGLTIRARSGYVR